MGDVIVYTTVSKDGGVDGRSLNDKGGVITGAFLDKGKAQNYGKGYNEVKPIVVDLEEVAKATLKGLDPVARLAVETYLETRTRTR